MLTLTIGCLESLDWTHPSRIKCLFRCRTVLIQAVALLKVAPTSVLFCMATRVLRFSFYTLFLIAKRKEAKFNTRFSFNSLSEPNVIVGCSLAALLIFH